MKILKNTLLSLLILTALGLNAQVAINTDGSDADASAILDVKSTEKGFLPPRMTEAQMNAISNPAEGLIVYCADCSPKGPYYYDGSNWLNFATNGPSDLGETDVYNPATGKVWMNRNLGASQVATSSTDADAYGDLYQWGRGTDGHEKRNSGTTSTLSNSNTPGHGDFITNGTSPYDWRSPQNDNLWQDVNGINNPCPSGYRLPTEAEWNAERQSWDSNNAAGAIGSPLKLPVAGKRNHSDGALGDFETAGFFWSSNVSDTHSLVLIFGSSDAFLVGSGRARGYSVRCIMD